MMSRHHLAARGALLVIAACWGATFVVAKNALTYITPEWLTFYRFLLASAVLLAVMPRASWSRLLLRHGTLLGAFVFAGYWLQTSGLVYTTPSRSAFITGAGIVLVPFVERLIFRNRIRAVHVIGTLLATTGLHLLLGGLTGRLNTGDVLTLFCAVAFSVHVVLASRFAQIHHPIALAAIQITTVALCALPTLPFSENRPISAETVLVIVFLALVNTSLALYVMMWAQAKISAAEAAIILSFEPVAAAITSVVAGTDAFTTSLILGGGLVVSGMIIAQRRSTVET